MNEHMQKERIGSKYVCCGYRTSKQKKRKTNHYKSIRREFCALHS